MTSDDLAARGAPERIWAFGSRCTQNRLLGTAFAGTPYILATPTALAASPEVAALIREAEARGMERAADMVAVLQEACVDECVRIWAEERSEEIRAEAAALRGEKEPK